MGGYGSCLAGDIDLLKFFKGQISRSEALEVSVSITVNRTSKFSVCEEPVCYIDARNFAFQ